MDFSLRLASFKGEISRGRGGEEGGCRSYAHRERGEERKEAPAGITAATHDEEKRKKGERHKQIKKKRGKETSPRDRQLLRIFWRHNCDTP